MIFCELTTKLLTVHTSIYTQFFVYLILNMAVKTMPSAQLLSSKKVNILSFYLEIIYKIFSYKEYSSRIIYKYRYNITQSVYKWYTINICISSRQVQDSLFTFNKTKLLSCYLFFVRVPYLNLLLRKMQFKQYNIKILLNVKVCLFKKDYLLKHGIHYLFSLRQLKVYFVMIINLSSVYKKMHKGHLYVYWKINL